MKRFKPKNAQRLKDPYRKLKNAYAKCAGVFLSAALLPTNALAADPVAAIDNLSNLISNAISGVGGIIIIFGIVQIGMSIPAHDSSQRVTGFLSFFGGVVIAMHRFILDVIQT